MRARGEKWEDRPEKKVDGGLLPQRDSLGCIPRPIDCRGIDPTFGFGVFAAQDLPTKTFIGEYTGILKKRSNFKDRDNDYRFDYQIDADKRGPYVLDGERGGNHTRFINHSTDPNIESYSCSAMGCYTSSFTRSARSKGGSNSATTMASNTGKEEKPPPN